jgi:hypothetical protein
MPNINRIAGAICERIISAQNPRKIHINIPLLSSCAPDAANAVAGAMIPVIVASVLMASSFFCCNKAM